MRPAHHPRRDRPGVTLSDANTSSASAPAPTLPWPAPDDVAADARRWWILAVLCVCLLVVGIDTTIVNVALPTIVHELGASTSQLQWIVDAYTLTFASFLLLAGSLGDRYGRRLALTIGLVVFGAGSLASALAGSAGVLVATRAVQGLGGAFIMPSTLSILTNVFPAPERGRAIGIWAGVSGLGIAIGPISGGYLLEHFYWGSIFLVNIPIVVLALVATAAIVPNSLDPRKPRLDPVGTVLSIGMLATLLYGIIEGPTRGWSDAAIIGAFAAAALLIGCFVAWELHSDHPMLDVSFFANRRFSAASIAVTLVFFAMTGSVFFFSQYLQFVLGYDPLEAGVRILPVAAAIAFVAPLSARLVTPLGTKVVVTAGLTFVAVSLLIFSRVSIHSGYGLVALVLVIMGGGMALAMAPATDSIMGSLPRERAGIGSAVNDTTRQVGGALGVAILGSITASSYHNAIDSSAVYHATAKQSPQAAAALHDSIGSAIGLASHLPPASAQIVTAAVNAAFVHALGRTVVVGAGFALLGALVAAIFLPARPAGDVDPAPGSVVSPSKIDVALQLCTDAALSSLAYNGVACRSGVATRSLGVYRGAPDELGAISAAPTAAT